MIRTLDIWAGLTGLLIFVLILGYHYERRIAHLEIKIINLEVAISYKPKPELIHRMQLDIKKLMN